MTRTRRVLICVLSMTAVASAVAAEEADVLSSIDGRYDDTARIARTLWDYAEVGYQETRSGELLQQTLRDEGFSIEAGVAAIPAAFVASLGSGGPVIRILANFKYEALLGERNPPLDYRK
jgi:aminobenzoyl-glutamate utilization protein B